MGLKRGIMIFAAVYNNLSFKLLNQTKFMSLVGKKAPVFSAPAVINGEEIVEQFSLEQYLGEKEVIFFFYPKDFTFVCPTEIHAFQEKLGEF